MVYIFLVEGELLSHSVSEYISFSCLFKVFKDFRLFMLLFLNPNDVYLSDKVTSNYESGANVSTLLSVTGVTGFNVKLIAKLLLIKILRPLISSLK